MRLFKWLLVVLVADALCSQPVRPQAQLVGKDPFPAPMEFKEISAPRTEKTIDIPAELEKLDRGPILIQTGLKRYAERDYALTNPGKLSVAVMTFSDPRESYSALTFLSGKEIKPGPPGDFSAGGGEALLFAAGPCVVRIDAPGNGDLANRVATSVANRIGRKTTRLPTLVRHLPLANCDPGSIRYFVAPAALTSLGTPVAGSPLQIPPEVETAQARFSASGESGTITLLSFPTVQLADDFYNSGALYEAGAKNGSLYTREAGPLVGILEGNFSPASADKVLSSVKFEYSIKWIYDKSRNQGRTIWGVPVRILTTVVRSILFTAILCLASIVLGIVMAFGRLYVRRRLGRTDDDAYIRLKINED